jgi:hypothetical protein
MVESEPIRVDGTGGEGGIASPTLGLAPTICVEKLTKAPSTVDDADVEALRRAGWDEKGIYEAAALASFFNFSGRLEAASGLPPDEVPTGASPPEARAETT